MTRFSLPTVEGVSRYRLRVGNEELAVSLGTTLIGRDASCRITIYDSLISRRHARISCDGEQATVEDLGSRNGTRVNGVVISGPHKLRAGDRIGIGAYELSVYIVDENDDGLMTGPPTGLLNICTDCRTPYSAAEKKCPHCGSTRVGREVGKRNEDTTRGRWSLGMLIEMLGRTMLTENVAEVDKLMRQAALLVSEQHRAAEPISEEELHALGEVSTWLAKTQNSAAWREWYADTRTQLGK